MTFSGTAGQVVSVQLVSSTHPNLGAVGYQIRKPDGTQLTGRQAGTPLASPGILLFDHVTLPTTGTYTLWIDPADLETGATTLQLS
jgi:hypothetical protein